MNHDKGGKMYPLSQKTVRSHVVRAWSRVGDLEIKKEF